MAELLLPNPIWMLVVMVIVFGSITFTLGHVVRWLTGVGSPPSAPRLATLPNASSVKGIVWPGDSHPPATVEFVPVNWPPVDIAHDQLPIMCHHGDVSVSYRATTGTYVAVLFPRCNAASYHQSKQRDQPHAGPTPGQWHVYPGTDSDHADYVLALPRRWALQITIDGTKPGAPTVYEVATQAEAMHLTSEWGKGSHRTAKLRRIQGVEQDTARVP